MKNKIITAFNGLSVATACIMIPVVGVLYKNGDIDGMSFTGWITAIFYIFRGCWGGKL
jgi:hypothetical protein